MPKTRSQRRADDDALLMSSLMAAKVLSKLRPFRGLKNPMKLLGFGKKIYQVSKEEFEKSGGLQDKVSDGTTSPLVDWIRQHPWGTAGIGAGLGVTGALGGRLLQGSLRNPSALQKELQKLVKKKGLSAVYPKLVVPASGQRAQNVLEAMDEIERKGKVFEQGPRLGLSHLFPRGQSTLDVARKHGIPLPTHGASDKEKAKFLNRIQSALKAEYGESGFVVKPHGLVSSAGAFPSEKGNWGDVYADYQARLRPAIEKLKADVKKNPAKYRDLAAGNVVANKFRSDPAYTATGMESAIANPAKVLAQEKMQLVKGVSGKPSEYRVHVIRGEAPKELAYNRYEPGKELGSRVPLLGRLLRSKKTGSSEEAASWVRDNVVPNLNKKYRQGSFGIDVARVKKKDGGWDYKLVELNPSSSVGSSGFLDPAINPALKHDVHKWLTGKDSPLVTTAKAFLGAGVGAAGGVAANRLANRGPTVEKSASMGTSEFLSLTYGLDDELRKIAFDFSSVGKAINPFWHLADDAAVLVASQVNKGKKTPEPTLDDLKTMKVAGLGSAALATTLGALKWFASPVAMGAAGRHLGRINWIKRKVPNFIEAGVNDALRGRKASEVKLTGLAGLSQDLPRAYELGHAIGKMNPVNRNLLRGMAAIFKNKVPEKSTAHTLLDTMSHVSFHPEDTGRGRAFSKAIFDPGGSARDAGRGIKNLVNRALGRKITD